MGNYVTLGEYAKHYGVDPANVRQKIARKTLKARKFGRDWMIDIDQPYNGRKRSADKEREVIDNNDVATEEIYQTYVELTEKIIMRYERGVLPVETWEKHFPMEQYTKQQKELAERLIQDINRLIKALER